MGYDIVDVAGFEPLREVAAASLTASYAALGTALAFRSNTLTFANTLDGDVYISLDGTNDHFWLPASTSLTLNLADINVVVKRGTTIYVKDGNTAPTAGRLAVSSIHRA